MGLIVDMKDVKVFHRRDCDDSLGTGKGAERCRFLVSVILMYT